MKKAVGWVLILMIVLLVGTHPGTLAGLTQQAVGVLHRAGDELSSFAGKL